jgi:hypothetical protein
VGSTLGLVNSNIFWGEDNQYGRMNMPGHKVIHLPSGTVRVSAAVTLPGRGNVTPDLAIPRSFAFTVEPVSGTAKPVIEENYGPTENSLDSLDDTQRQVADLHVPEDGDYAVASKTTWLGFAVNPQLWFGYTPGFLTGWDVWLVALIGSCIGVALYEVFYGRRKAAERAKAAGTNTHYGLDWTGIRRGPPGD